MATEIDEQAQQQKALKLARRVWDLKAEYREALAAGAGSRRRMPVAMQLSRAAPKAETALFRVICAAPGDLGARIGYGGIATLRTTAYSPRKRLGGGVAISAARSALWALYGVDLSGPSVGPMERLVTEPAVRSEYSEHGPEVDGQLRLALAAEARFRLAELLVQTGRPQGKELMTPQQLDATLGARDKFYSSDEALLWSCQLASCRGYSAGEEAGLLVTEATRMYRYLDALGNRYGADDVARAQVRRDAVLQAVVD
jgi:hypothetical protein